jgi:hypothetical protein
MSPAENLRLNSWKEIAAYLGRNLRTVRRWEENRSLPVHRVPGDGRRSVYAFSKEIEAWLLEENDVPHDNRPQSMDALAAPAPKDQSFHEVCDLGAVITKPNNDADLALAPANTKTKGSRFRYLGLSILIIGVIFGAVSNWLLRPRPPSSANPVQPRQRPVAADSSDPINITSVSPVQPERDQTIIIRGTNLGFYTPYRNLDTPFLAIRDNTAHWAAGRIIPENWDEVTLNVQSWQDTQIVVTGFSGSYGSGAWKLTRGDEVEIAVWNPQSGQGPALYQLSVSSEENRVLQ